MTRRDDAVYAFAVIMTLVGVVIGAVVAVRQHDWSLLVQCVATLVWMASAVLWYNTARQQGEVIEEIDTVLRRITGEEQER